MKVISHNGIVFTAEDKMTPVLRNITQGWARFDQSTSKSAGRVRQNLQKAFKGLDTDLINTNAEMMNKLQAKYGDGFKQILARYRDFNKTVNSESKTFSHMIMAGVAMSMSGITIKRAGDAVLGTIKGWTEAASEFEKTMAQIRFLGRVSAKDFKPLKDTIVQLGIELPTSNLETAQAALAALKTGYSAKALSGRYGMTRQISLLSFFSEGKLGVDDSTKLLNSMTNQTGVGSKKLLNYLIRTATAGPLDIDEIDKAWKSQRSGYQMMGDKIDLPKFLALMSAARSTQNPRMAGFMLQQYAAGTLNMFNPTKRGASAMGKLGITTDLVKNLDPIQMLSYINDKVKTVSSNKMEQQSIIKDLLTRSGMNMVTAFGSFGRATGMSVGEMEKLIRDADNSNFSEKYLKQMMNTYWGMQQVLQGTKETFQQTMGEMMAPVIIPIMNGLQGIFGSITEFVRKYPAIGKVLGLGTGLAGVLLSVGGAAAIVGGQVLSMFGSFNNMALQLAIAKIKTLADFANLEGNFKVSIRSMLTNNVVNPLKQAAKWSLITVGTMAALYVAWKIDFLGLRSASERFYNNLVKSHTRAMDIIHNYRNGKNGSSFVKELVGLEGSGNYWDWLTAKLVKVTTFWNAFTEAIRNFNKTGKFSISKSTIANLIGVDKDKVGGKVDPNGTYMLADLTRALNLYASLKALWDGFQIGVKAAWGLMRGIIHPFLQFAEILTRALGAMGVPGLNNPAVDKWKVIGTVIGNIVGYVAAIKVGTFIWKNTLGGVFKFLGGIGRFFVRHKKIIGDESGLQFSGLSKRTTGKIGRGSRRFFNWMVNNSSGIGRYKVNQFDPAFMSYINKRAYGYKGKAVLLRRKGFWGALSHYLFGSTMATSGGKELGRTRGLIHTKPFMAIRRAGRGIWDKLKGAGGFVGGMLPMLLGGAIGGIGALGTRNGKFSFGNIQQSLTSALDYMQKNGYKIADSLIKDLIKYGPKIMDAFGKLVVTTFSAVWNAILNNSPRLREMLGIKATTKEQQDQLRRQTKGDFAQSLDLYNQLQGYEKLGLIDKFKKAGEYGNIYAAFQQQLFKSVRAPGAAGLYSGYVNLPKYKALQRYAATNGLDISNLNYAVKKTLEYLKNHPNETGGYTKAIKTQDASVYRTMTFNKSTINANNAKINLSAFSIYRKPTKKHAGGGIVGSRTYTELGERGPEMVLPLSGNYQKNVSLWATAGRFLGMGTQTSSSSNNGSGGGVELNFNEGSIVIHASLDTTDPTSLRKLSKQLMVEIKKVMEEEQMRNYQRVNKV
jgi:TP901 family phage tail tape measure protein